MQGLLNLLYFHVRDLLLPGISELNFQFDAVEVAGPTSCCRLHSHLNLLVLLVNVHLWRLPEDLR